MSHDFWKFMVHDFLKINVPRFFGIHRPRFFGIQWPTIFCDFGLFNSLAQAGGGGPYYMIFHYQKHTVLNYWHANLKDHYHSFPLPLECNMSNMSSNPPKGMFLKRLDQEMHGLKLCWHAWTDSLRIIKPNTVWLCLLACIWSNFSCFSLVMGSCCFGKWEDSQRVR